jgi:regulatory protein
MRNGNRKRRSSPATAGELVEPVVIDAEKARERTMHRAVKLLAAKPRSTGELRTRLLEKKWTNEEIVDAVLEKLLGYGYLNDEQFARGFASFQIRQKPVGRKRLERALALKKIDKEIADEAIDQILEETPEEKLIDEAIKKRIRLKGKPQTRQETKNLFDHLLRRGFSFDLVIQKVRESGAVDMDED